MDELRVRARTNGVGDRVRFLGDQPQDRVATYLAAADVVCIPSVRDDRGNVDGLPNVVLEALASGTPLVTTGAGGIGAVVEDGVTASERDAAAIAAAVLRILGQPDMGRRMGRAGRALVAARFGWDRTAERFDHAYSQALAFSCPGR
jgi:glycosyltransferase involved in cell wall biosynthesis